jgi:hypothetical protein
MRAIYSGYFAFFLCQEYRLKEKKEKKKKREIDIQ